MNKKFEKRRYQEKTVENFQQWMKADDKFASIILPTGTGKSAVMAMCIDELPKNEKVLWCAHREELIDQGKDTINEIAKDRVVSIEMADQKGDTDADVVVGSVQSLARNRKHFQDFNPRVVFIDEAHHFSEKNKQYQSLVEKYPNAKFVSATATPWRSSGEELPLGTKLIEMDIGTAVAKNYIVPPKPRVLNTNVSLANVKTTAGDFDIGQLSKVINTDDRNELIAKNVLQLIREEKRQGILFGVDVEHAKSMYKLISPHVRAAEVYGDTPKEERRELIKKVRNGEIDILINNLVYVEGFDAAHLSFGVIARPTRSLSLWIQMAGRVLRKFANKTDAIIVDVWDKIKTSQSRVTFYDMAIVGDLYGDNKIAEAIVDEPLKTEKLNMDDKIAEKLINFPVFIKKQKQDRWTMDQDTWFASSWVLAENQWAITWSKEVSIGGKSKEEYIYDPLFGPPHSSDLIDGTYVVKHQSFGTGIVRAVKNEDGKCLIGVEFDNKKIDINYVPLDSLQKREIVQTLDDTIPAKNMRISRLFYVCFPPDSDTGRLIHLTKRGANLIVEQDLKGTKEQIDRTVREQAQMDDAIPLIRASAQWKREPGSDKQKALIKNYIKWGKVDQDLDIDTITKGECGSIIDMMTWKEVINRYFAVDKKEELIGYNLDDDL